MIWVHEFSALHCDERMNKVFRAITTTGTAIGAPVTITIRSEAMPVAEYCRKMEQAINDMPAIAGHCFKAAKHIGSREEGK